MLFRGRNLVFMEWCGSMKWMCYTADLIGFWVSQIHSQFIHRFNIFGQICVIYLFLYLDFHDEFATTTNQLCYSKYVDEFLMTIVQSCRDYGISNVLLF